MKETSVRLLSLFHMLSSNEKHFPKLLLVAVLGILAYSNTLQSPFQWDDKFPFIVGNPIVRDISYFLEPSKAQGFDLFSALKGRYVGYLTFALNYRMSGFNVTGFHIVNISIHLINALLVYVLALLTFRTPFMSSSALSNRSGPIAFFSALIFVVHPVQTEAVTYIFQRLASLVTMFYLLSIISYIKARSKKLEVRSQKSENRQDTTKEGYLSRRLWLLCSVICAILAMKTKENAFTLPLMIMLYEFSFFNGPVKRRLVGLAPLLLTMLIIPLNMTGIDRPVGEIIGQIGPASRGFSGLSRTDYLFTQFRVIVTYIRLLFLPAGQNIDYDFPIFRSFFDPAVYVSFAFLLMIIVLGVYLYRRSTIRETGLRMLGFGIFWFFIAISVESSIIPIPMLIDEYRVYLPSAGFIIGLVSFAFMLIERVEEKIRALITSLAIVVTLVLTYATYERNSVWESEISLWEDVVAKSPGKARGYHNLGLAYAEKNDVDRALRAYNRAIELKPDEVFPYNNRGNIFLRKKLYDSAFADYTMAIQIKPDFAEAYVNRGVVYYTGGQYDRAIEDYSKAISLKPYVAEFYDCRGDTYMKKGKLERALDDYDKAISIDSNYAEAHLSRGTIYASLGRLNDALADYRAACERGNKEGCEALGSATR